MGQFYGIVFVVFVCCASVVLCAGTYGITIEGPKCGQKVCKTSEYCSEFDNTCQPCSVVCDVKSHNYEKNVCELQCQDYLHDIRYVRQTGSNDNDLRGTVERLSKMLTVTLVLVVFMLIVLAGVLCFQLYRWKVKKNITLEVIRSKFFKKSSDNNPNAATSTSQQGNKKRDLRLEMPSPTVNSDHSPVTVTTSIDRRPAEDSALDYAYDNPAMAKSVNTSY